MTIRTTFACLHCGTEQPTRKNTKNLYCTNACQAQRQWETVTRPRIEKGDNNVRVASLKRYLKEKFGDKCFECPTTSEWNGQPLTLQIDHIDGDSDNNQVVNLRLLCPNCHTQTPTYGRKGIPKAIKNTARARYRRGYACVDSYAK